MKKLVLIMVMLFGVVASSYNNSRPQLMEETQGDINSSLDGFATSLDSLNTIVYELK